MLDTVKTYFTDLQNRLCQELEGIDAKAKFKVDNWTSETVSEASTRVITDGGFIEQGAVNFSLIDGGVLPKSASTKYPELAGKKFQATGVSLIIHPLNPYVPTTHFNIRFFQCGETWWFGGGFDLTPYYGFDEDCAHWHNSAKNACDPFGENIYPEFKKHCDEYFYLKHRDEPRGIGGLFFDDLHRWDFDTSFDFIKSIGDNFMGAYIPIVQRRKDTPFGERERDFQLYRRGRYVEFNLLQDRGTLFGIQSKGRTESILVSMPPKVAWRYNWQPEAGSPEETLYEKYLTPREWADNQLVTS